MLMMVYRFLTPLPSFDSHSPFKAVQSLTFHFFFYASASWIPSICLTLTASTPALVLAVCCLQFFGPIYSVLIAVFFNPHYRIMYPFLLKLHGLRFCLSFIVMTILYINPCPRLTVRFRFKMPHF